MQLKVGRQIDPMLAPEISSYANPKWHSQRVEYTQRQSAPESAVCKRLVNVVGFAAALSVSVPNVSMTSAAIN